MEFLIENIKLVDWTTLSANGSDGALDLLEAHPNNIDWSQLCLSRLSPRAIALLLANPVKINWNALSRNDSDEALDLLEANIHEICWPALIKFNKSPRAETLLFSKPGEIDWQAVSNSPQPWAKLLTSKRKRAVELCKSVL